MIIVKRCFDLGVAAIGLLFLTPIVLILALWIKFESPGPAIFRQIRIGKGQREFECLKLRSMFANTDQRPTHEIAEQSVTKTGAIMRKMRLDEIPQLLNVLKGEMSLVGPRPCLPDQRELIAARAQENVFSVLPGITGLAQARGVDMSDPQRLAQLDGEYVRRQSFAGDMRILLQTITSFAENRQVDHTRSSDQA